MPNLVTVYAVCQAVVESTRENAAEASAEVLRDAHLWANDAIWTPVNVNKLKVERVEPGSLPDDPEEQPDASQAVFPDSDYEEEED